MSGERLSVWKIAALIYVPWTACGVYLTWVNAHGGGFWQLVGVAMVLPDFLMGGLMPRSVRWVGVALIPIRLALEFAYVAMIVATARAAFRLIKKEAAD